MSQRTTTLFKAALSALYYTGAGRLLSPLTSGAGVIFTLHQVSPEAPKDFEPNRILKITPEFLEQVLRLVIESGFEILSLDEVPARLKNGGTRPFACFTFDDGYRDNYEYAYPIFKRYGVPFAVYVPTDFVDGRGDLWWLALEEAVRAADVIDIDMDEGPRRFVTGTTAEKEAAFDAIYWWLRKMDETRARAIVAKLAVAHGIDTGAVCRDLIMNWDELREMAADPLVTIGAHTRGHYALSRLPADQAREEMAASVRRIEAELGRPCRHFSYPYGCEMSAGPREFAIAKDLGITTAVTTNKALIHPRHADALTGLPRVSLNGDYQDGRYIEVMLSGAPFAIWNAVRRAVPRRAAAG